MKRLVTLVAGAALVAGPATAMAAPQPASTQSESGPTLEVEQVPFAMDSSNQAGWWRPHAEFNGSTYMAFDAPHAGNELRHEVHIAKRTPSGEWTSGCVQDDAAACATYSDDIGHNQPSIAVDGNGYVHAFVSMHNNQWQYARSGEPESVTTLVDRADEFRDDGAVTYPVTASAPNGDVYVIVRVDDGAGYSGRLYHWDVTEGSWELVDTFARESGFTPYPDDLQVDRAGNVHILWQWAKGGPSGSRYFGSYLVYQPRKDEFSTISGREVTVPATTTSDDVVYEPGDGVTQQAKFALMNTSAPILTGIAYRYRPQGSDDYQVRWAAWEHGGWTRETVDDGLPAGTTPSIGATHHDGSARIYYIKPPACDQRDQIEHGGLYVAEKHVSGRPRPGDWQTSWLGAAPGVERLGAETRQDGTDSLYVAAPREGNPIAEPALYLATLERDDASLGAEPGWVDLDPPDRTNLAHGAEVSVSSTWSEQSIGKCAVDGNYWAEGSRWISATDDPDPTITVDFGQTVDVGEVHVHSGRFAGTDDIETTFAVEVRDGGQWREIAEVTGNELSPAIVVASAGTQADQLRLRFPPGIHRIYEVAAYPDVQAETVGLDLSADPESLAFPGDSTLVRAALMNRTPDDVEGGAEIEVPEGWTAEPTAASYELAPYGSGEVTFTVTSPTGAPSHGEFELVVRTDHESEATHNLVIREGIVYLTDGKPFFTQTGVWEDSLLPGHNGSLTRFSSDPGATATWAPELRTAGMYNVHVWYPANQNTTTEAQYTVSHADGEDAVVLSQRDTPDRWNLLGTWEFDAGMEGTVTVESLDSVALRADAVWFEAVEEPGADAPTTGFEERDGQGWTTHQEELDFLAELADVSPRVRVSEVGESAQGRPIQVVQVGHPEPPPVTEIAAGSSVLTVASQHGNEPAGREMALQVARDLAVTEDPDLLAQLGDTTVLFVPTANPDGREANTRGNADGVNVNRDHLHFDTPEGEVIGAVLRDFDPEIAVDAHERPGDVAPDMEATWPLNLNVDEQLRDLNREMIEDYLFPGLNSAGFTTGELGRPGGTAEDERILRNALGLRHGLGLVTETPWDGEPLRRVDAQVTLMEQVLGFYRERDDDVDAETAGAQARRATDGQARAPFFFDGADDQVADPAPCGYLINGVQSAGIDRHVDLFGIEREQVSEDGVFVTMAQPMMTVTPLLLDARADFNLVEGYALDDCSDPGSLDPPPPPTPPGQFSTDFSTDVAGESPQGWSTQWRPSDWIVLDDPRRLRHVVTAPAGRRAVTWDGVGDSGVLRGDVEVFGLVRASQTGDTVFQMGIHISGDAAGENAYYVDARAPSADIEPNHLRINRYQNGSASFLGAAGLPFIFQEDTWYRVLLRREGNSLQAKMWPDGDDEPPGWQVTVSSDSAHDSGRVGVSHFTPETVNDWAFIGVGTGGEQAPHAPAL